MYLDRKCNVRRRSASIQKRFLISHGLTASVSLCIDGWSSGEDMGQRNKARPFTETFPTPCFPTFCRLVGESDHFQVTLSLLTIAPLPQSLGRGSPGKAGYHAKNKDFNFCMWDGHQALASPPFYLLPLLLHCSSTTKQCKVSTVTSPPTLV